MFRFKNINKRQFCNIVANKIGPTINKAHIISVVSILFEEIFKDLAAGLKFKIGNFGTFFLKKMKPRKFFNVTEMKVTESIGNKIFKFKFSKKNRRKILDAIDVEKTFGEK